MPHLLAQIAVDPHNDHETAGWSAAPC